MMDGAAAYGAGLGDSGVQTPSRRSLRLMGALLAMVAALYVAVPGGNALVEPLLREQLGLDGEDALGLRVVLLSAAVLALAVVTRAVAAWGHHAILTGSLALFCAGAVFLAGHVQLWSYLAGRLLVTVALIALTVTGLSMVPALHMPGRIRATTAGWMIAMSGGFVVSIVVASRMTSVARWQLLMAVLAAGTGAVLLLVHRCLPDTEQHLTYAKPDRVRALCRLAVLLLAAAGLQLAPLWGWEDDRVGLLLIAAAFAALLARYRARVAARSPKRRPDVADRVWAPMAVAGAMTGFTLVVLIIAVPTLVMAQGGGRPEATFALAAFGAGGVLGAVVARRASVTLVAASSLGLPLTALGLALTHIVPNGAASAALSASATLALCGFGLMLALAPLVARFLAEIPHRQLGSSVGLLPGSILLGSTAAHAIPSASGLFGPPTAADAHELLWVGTIVVAVAALLLGRPVVALSVATAAGLQYLLVRADAGPAMAVAVALAMGALVGGVVWLRSEQTGRLNRAQESAAALQRAVVRPIPRTLGLLRLAGMYAPAGADTGVGGDFLEAVRTPFGTRILIGDVRGKGLGTVQTVTDLLGCFRSQAHETAELGELAARLDRQVARAAAGCDEELFATALLVQQADHPDLLEVVNCGHVAPIALGPGGLREIDVPSLLPLGFATLDATCEAPRPAPLRLDGDTTLLLYTDGLSEARNASGEFYPIAARLTRSAPSAPDPDDLIRRLDDDVRNWTHRLNDDITLIALSQATPTPAPCA
ncbi:SpoIIE family protein phosphatase [Yinghuangia soli]|uniref:SpoIIE family protein phosphatase n=1 Tax=Yinghuangia soli TaxID=2908204 RepID=A0AA41Q8Q7_9ACTN|nr:SpoIIE family protein phosphatase [Yinghuangia soli]MCF2533291.1 SpoIIE family protein phosphatase [Yinghuangia soli]